MKENKIIEQLKQQCPDNASVKLGIGDDSAVLNPSDREQLVCADMLMEGVHFILDSHNVEKIGHKALAVNLSDIAAMGGEALSAYICLALPRSHAESRFMERLYSGFSSLAQRFQVAIAGGDTNIWEGPLVISVTVVGAVHPKGAVTRRGARVGDVIMVTGELGGSIEGHHLDFTPRLAEARILMDGYKLHSMIDVSDGLGKDLRDICRQSGVAASLDPELLPLRGPLLKMPRAEAQQRALSDGEDFELCFTLSEKEAERLEARRDISCHRIGRIIAGEGLYWGHNEKTWEPIHVQGYEH
ncbi:MAG TPA: thiamine-phosphate kinase [Oligoflexus sp.]|uniref:thiamine-phosphate kinase n=1 Tax=Oligoflexus sp. TaxID=1971216 RepID=UPI002D3F3681|nr:thiamine-phosphate kinase [Oligoflexus sp.]HYX33011.1 thiamine-phosphate kinase [Oligoflexus sp.]